MAVIGNNSGSLNLAGMQSEISQLAGRLLAKNRHSPASVYDSGNGAEAAQKALFSYTVNNRELNYLHSDLSFGLQGLASQQGEETSAGTAAAAYRYVSGVASRPRVQYELLHPYNRSFDFKV